MKKWHLYMIAVVAVLILGIFTGWNLKTKLRPCPVPVADTLYVWDTVVHTIETHVPYYIIRVDTVYSLDTIPQPVDTAAILKDYFAIHVYEREWKDTNIVVNLKDTITKNYPMDSRFSYKILRPQQIINNVVDNSITYNSYIYAGLGAPINDASWIDAEILYVNPKFYIGGGYAPFQKSATVKIGIPIVKFQKTSKQ